MAAVLRTEENVRRPATAAQRRAVRRLIEQKLKWLVEHNKHREDWETLGGVLSPLALDQRGIYEPLIDKIFGYIRHQWLYNAAQRARRAERTGRQP